MYKAVKIVKGPSGGWGGPLVIQADEKKNKILYITVDGKNEVVEKLEQMTGCEAVDGSKTSVPDSEVLVAVVDCGGAARCGVYPKKGIFTVNLLAGGATGLLAKYITEDIYVSAVGVDQITFADGSEAPQVAPKKAESAPKTKAEAKEEVAAMNEKKKVGIITRVGIGVGKVVNKFFAAGRESIDMVIKNILPFMAFTSTILGIITVSGLGDIIADTIAPFCSTLPSMLVISLICALPFLSPILGPGAVIAQVVGTLLGSQIAMGAIPPQYALPALFAIDAQVGGDFVPVGLSLGEAESETIELGVPAVLYSRVITGPVSVIIAYLFSMGLYS